MTEEAKPKTTRRRRTAEEKLGELIEAKKKLIAKLKASETKLEEQLDAARSARASEERSLARYVSAVEQAEPAP